MIEHFSKWIGLVALPDKFSEGAAYSFLDCVLNRFGAPAEVLTDQDREFLGEFQMLCEQVMTDHCTTSRDHPEAEGSSKGRWISGAHGSNREEGASEVQLEQGTSW
jgi:hypothetical protein